MMAQHWRNARAARFANTAGAQGTTGCPTGAVGATGPAGSLWSEEDLCTLLSGIDALQHGGRLPQHSDELFRKLLGRSTHVYAKLSRYANWGTRGSPTQPQFVASDAKLESLAVDPGVGIIVCSKDEMKQAIRRLYDKKKLTFIDKQVLQRTRDAIHQHLRYIQSSKVGAATIKGL